MKHFIRDIAHPDIWPGALKVALLVGTILNLINNYEILLNFSLTGKTLIQIILTYMVPYLVSAHGQLIPHYHDQETGSDPH